MDVDGGADVDGTASNMVGETKMSQLVGCCAGSEIW
jgi:hypothetical protein